MFGRLLTGALIAGAIVGFALPDGRGAKRASPAAFVEPTAAASPAQSSPAVSPLETVLMRADDGHFYVTAQVNGQPIRFLVDTGATGVALTREDAQRAGIQTGFDPPSVVARGASGDVRGYVVNIHHVAVDQKEAYDLRGVVITDDLGVSLLGQNFLAQVAKVEISGDRMILK